MHDETWHRVLHLYECAQHAWEDACDDPDPDRRERAVVESEDALLDWADALSHLEEGAEKEAIRCLKSAAHTGRAWGSDEWEQQAILAIWSLVREDV